MRNRRLTISALALILMTGCSADTTVNPEILDLVGTWEVTSWVYTSVADNTVTQTDTLRRGHFDRSCIPSIPAAPGCNAADSLGVPELEASVSYIVFYDDQDVLFVTHYVDTLQTLSTTVFLPVESEFNAEEWCIALADDDHGDHMHDELDCTKAANPDDLVIDEFGADELFLTFDRDGDTMTISSNDPTVEYAFDPAGAVLEPATFVIIMERIILDIPRPDLTCPGTCDLGT